MPRPLFILCHRAIKRAENLLYRMAGLPITIAALFASSEDTATTIRRAYAHHYWNPADWADALEIGVAVCIWPFALLGGALFFTWRNGSIVASRAGPAPWRQLLQQLRLAVTHGILPPWYYVFSLHDPVRRAVAPSFLNRCETKRGIYPVLARRRGATSPLDDKLAFAARCDVHQLSTVSVLATVRHGQIEWLDEPGLPPSDLFVKPVSACGGTGAERWDHVAGDQYAAQGGVILSAEQLVHRLAEQSHARPLLVQPRLINHRNIADLSNGALITIRVLTCLNEEGRPEVVGAILRMAVGANRTVDNLHAGGIASRVDLASGELSLATDLGMNARRGWSTRHPDTGAQIAGRILPEWPAVCELAEHAHLAFQDHALIGWDIALLPQGACLIEGNGAPDVDIMQRHGGPGLCDQRFGQLLAWHLAQPARASRCEDPPSPASALDRFHAP